MFSLAAADAAYSVYTMAVAHCIFKKSSHCSTLSPVSPYCRQISLTSYFLI